jgi:fibronectin type 3 domain-containing protein
LIGGTNYYYKISASDTSGEGAQSAYTSATTLRSAGPTGVTAAALSSSSIQITWDSVSGASSYTVYRATSATGTYRSIDASSAASYTNTGLNAGTTYYYKVSTSGTDGESNQSAYTSAITAPETPTGVTSYTNSASSIMISWNSVTGASSYTVYRATSATGAYTAIGTSSTNSYTNTGLSANTTYYYKIKAHNEGGESALSSETNTRTLILAPTGVTATAQSSSVIRLTWNAVSGASSYKVYQWVGYYSEIGTYTTTSLNVTGCSARTTYFFEVCAVGVNGEGERSVRVSATTY